MSPATVKSEEKTNVVSFRRGIEKCPLCGFEFSRDNMKCRGCPMSIGRCSVLCCPNCNYQFVEESKIVNIIKKIFKWRV